MKQSLKSILTSKITLLYIASLLLGTFGIFAFQLMNGGQLEYRYYQSNYAEYSGMMTSDDVYGKAWLDAKSTAHGPLSFLTLSTKTSKYDQLPLALMILILTLPVALSREYKNSNELGAGATITVLFGLLLEFANSLNWYGDFSFHAGWFLPIWYLIIIQPEIGFTFVLFIEMVVLSFALRSRFEKLRIIELRAERAIANGTAELTSKI